MLRTWGEACSFGVQNFEGPRPKLDPAERQRAAPGVVASGEGGLRLRYGPCARSRGNSQVVYQPNPHHGGPVPSDDATGDHSLSNEWDSLARRRGWSPFFECM